MRGHGDRLGSKNEAPGGDSKPKWGGPLTSLHSIIPKRKALTKGLPIRLCQEIKKLVGC